METRGVGLCVLCGLLIFTNLIRRGNDGWNSYYGAVIGWHKQIYLRCPALATILTQETVKKNIPDISTLLNVGLDTSWQLTGEENCERASKCLHVYLLERKTYIVTDIIAEIRNSICVIEEI